MPVTSVHGSKEAKRPKRSDSAKESDTSGEPKKKGFHGLGLETGNTLPQISEELQPFYKVGPDGELLWKVRDYYIAWLEATYSLREHILKKNDMVMLSIFRGFNLLSRALMGFPVNTNYTGWPLPPLPIFDHPSQIPQEWETAPMSLQKIGLEGAYEYLKPQLEAKARTEAEEKYYRQLVDEGYIREGKSGHATVKKLLEEQGFYDS